MPINLRQFFRHLHIINFPPNSRPVDPILALGAPKAPSYHGHTDIFQFKKGSQSILPQFIPFKSTRLDLTGYIELL